MQWNSLLRSVLRPGEERLPVAVLGLQKAAAHEATVLGNCVNDVTC